MIISKTVVINDRSYTETKSDSGFYIARNGINYAEAIDPLGSGREYTETDIPIHNESKPETTETKIVKIQNQTDKNTADIEYLAMMTECDLEV